MLAYFVSLPDDMKATITGLIIGVLGLAIDYLIGVLPPWLGPIGAFLKKYQQEWGLAIAAALITWLENALPSGYDDVILKGISFLLALIALFVPYFVLRNVFKARGVKAFAA